MNGVVSKLPICNLSILLFKLLKSFGTFSNLSISDWSKFDFKVAESTILAEFDVSPSVA